MTDTTQAKFELFKQLHDRPGTFVVPNPWDAGSARILTALGFEALTTTSAGFAFSIGHRDSAGTLTRKEVLKNAQSIVEATGLPVAADLEEGFGSAPQCCADTILAASKIGLVGGSIEDATGAVSNPIYEFEHAVDRVAAACEAAKGSHFLLTARAENFICGRPFLDDTIRRLQAFSAAGADVLYAPGLPSIRAIRTVCEAVDKPVNVVMGLKDASYTVDELQAAGVKRISVGGSFARAALGAFIRAAKEVRDKGTFSYSADAVSDSEAAAYMSSAKR